MATAPVETKARSATFLDAIQKRVGEARGDRHNDRLAQQRAYQDERMSSLGMATYVAQRDVALHLNNARIDFKLIHRGY